MPRILFLLVAMLFASFSSQAQTTIYGLGTLTFGVTPGGLFFPAGGSAGDQGLAAFDPVGGLPNAPLQKILPPPGDPAVVGKVVGIDFRPLTGQLYALSYDPALATNNAQLYTLNPKTGFLTRVAAAPITLTLGGATERIGFNFNPVADLIRVVSSNRANYRLSPTTGAVVATDGLLAYAFPTGQRNYGYAPRVGGVAYTNSFPGSTTTALRHI